MYEQLRLSSGGDMKLTIYPNSRAIHIFAEDGNGK